MKPSVIDLFAGVGGLSLGFEKQGFEVLIANEYDKSIAAAYTENHKNTKMIIGDITSLDLKEIFGNGKNVELVRLSHSKKKSKNYADTEKSAKNYTWTWRFDEPSVQLIRKNYVEIINILISNNDKSVGMAKLRSFYDDLKYYCVFKGNRHQIGRLFVEAVSYHLKKTGKNFRKMDYYIPLELNYLPRIKNYADDFIQYVFLRRIYESVQINLNKDDVNQDTYNELFNKYLV